MPRNWKKLFPLLLLLVSLSHCSTCNKLPLNFSAAFGWRGYADTDLPLADLGDEYTIAFRFMLQYPNSYAAPIISDSASGNFYVVKDYVNPWLAVNFNGTKQTFKGTTLAGSVWHHVAITRKNGKFSVFHNGVSICPDSGPCAIPAGSSATSGMLRLGRFADGTTFNGHDAQFYGFIDDVAVFKKALSANDITTLAAAKRLTGAEADLFAGFTFDDVTPSAMPLPDVLKRAVTFKTLTTGPVLPDIPAYKSLASQLRDSAFDAKLLPHPFQQTVMKLPFPAGEAWAVIQGYDNPNGSHNGAGDFCWDFILAGQDQSKTSGKPIFAAAGGTAIETKNDQDKCGDPSLFANYVMIQQAPTEIGAYLHFQLGSVKIAKNQTVVAGDELAKAGDTGNTGACGGFHLHFALHTAPESQRGTLITFPSAFNDYEVSTDNGATWGHVTRGVPQNGEWVRNPVVKP
jgi:murein DD-endopeptidase MepM/ murein hydrolase activator NlpD